MNKSKDDSKLKPDGKTVIRDTLNGQEVVVRVCRHGLSYLDCSDCLDLSKVKYRIHGSLWDKVKFHCYERWF